MIVSATAPFFQQQFYGVETISGIQLLIYSLDLWYNLRESVWR